MANYNIEMNMLNSSGGYDVLYPKVKVTLENTTNKAIGTATSPIVKTGKIKYTTGSTDTYGLEDISNNFSWICTSWIYRTITTTEIQSSSAFWKNFTIQLIWATFVLKSGILQKDVSYYVYFGANQESPFNGTYHYISGNIYEDNMYISSNKIYKQAECSIIIEQISNFYIKITPWEDITGNDSEIIIQLVSIF